MSNITLGSQTFATQTGSDAPVLSNFTFSSNSKFSTGRIVQVQNKIFTERLDIVTGFKITRYIIPDFFVDIKPNYSSSDFLIFCQLAMGFSNTPEWSWFISREISTSENSYANASEPHEPVGVASARGYGLRMYGYHGGPRDNDPGANDNLNEVFSFAHTVYDKPNTKKYLRYRPAFQNMWDSNLSIFLNRSSYNGDNGYITRGSSSITVWEIAQ
tara:strand:- start:9256 stop:9900 length:645 start_codon:yes stop_codon:yes gene_type:complete